MKLSFYTPMPLDMADPESGQSARVTGIGASESPTLVIDWREGPGYSCALSIYMDKTVGAKPETSPKAEAGRRLEGAIAAWAADKLDADEGRPYGHSVRSCLTPYMFASPDYEVRVQGSWRLLEVKNSTDSEGWGKDGSSEVPRRVWIQCQHQMYVTGEPFMFVAVLLWGYDLRVYQVTFSPDFVRDELLPICMRFWRCVETKTRPPVDGHGLTTKILASIYPASSEDSEPPPIPLDDDQDALMAVVDFHDADFRASEAQKDRDQAANVLRDKLGEAWAGTIGDHVAVTWKPDKRNRRTLRVKRAKGD